MIRLIRPASERDGLDGRPGLEHALLHGQVEEDVVDLPRGDFDI